MLPGRRHAETVQLPCCRFTSLIGQVHDESAFLFCPTYAHLFFFVLTRTMHQFFNALLPTYVQCSRDQLVCFALSHFARDRVLCGCWLL